MVQLIDLYAEHFDPTYSAEELSLYHQGGTVDPLVRKYLELLKSCRTVIFITPCWWNSIPGMLKGVIDKVMKEDPRLLSMAGRLLSEWNRPDDHKTALLAALRPYVKPERYAKVDRAIQIAKFSRLIRVALAALREGGGQEDV